MLYTAHHKSLAIEESSTRSAHELQSNNVKADMKSIYGIESNNTRLSRVADGQLTSLLLREVSVILFFITIAAAFVSAGSSSDKYTTHTSL
jgi:hypothetical protein